MIGPRFARTPLPIQGRTISVMGRVSGPKGDESGPLTLSLDQITFIAGNTNSTPSSPSKSSKGPGYFKKRKRDLEDAHGSTKAEEEVN